MEKKVSQSSGRTKAQNGQLHSILSKLNFSKEEKEDMVYSFTSGRTSRSSEMTPKECDEAIRTLQMLTTITPKSETRQNNAENKMRRKIISFCHEMRMTKDDGKIDMYRVNKLIEEKGYLKKPFNNYTAKELPKLIHQVEQMRNSLLKAI